MRPISFYRYIRPVLFNENRAELVTQKKGGVCLRFEELDGNLWFTYSAADHTQLFSKEVAKRIADERARMAKENGLHATGLFGTLPFTKDTSALCKSVVEFCLSSPAEAGPRMVYMFSEYQKLGVYLHLLVSSNDSQERMMRHWKDAVHAAKYAEQYGVAQ